MKNLKSHKKWNGKKAVIVIHEATVGPGHDLRDYLLDHGVGELLFISHPLLFMPEMIKDSSRYEYYKYGKLVRKNLAFHFVLPEPLLYIKDILFTLYWSLAIIKRIDLFVGVANINALCGIILQRLGIANKTIYYVIDFVPVRFKNNIMNNIYHLVDRISAQYSNETWNLSPRMIEGRENKWHTIFPNQIVVPHGVHFSRIKRIPFRESNKHEIIYMGTIFKKQGIQIVIEALPKIVKSIPTITFSIIGKGPYLDDLILLTKKLRLENYIKFLGYIENPSEMENRLAKASIAVALYDRNSDIYDFTYYADPGKIKNYLGAGVPVLMTDVAYVAKEIEKAKCGLIVRYDKIAVENALLTYFSEIDTIKTYKSNALRFAKKYEWESVFTRAFTHSTK